MEVLGKHEVRRQRQHNETEQSDGRARPRACKDPTENNEAEQEGRGVYFASGKERKQESNP